MSEHKLQVDALGHKPMSLGDVYSISSCCDLMTREKLIEVVGKLCLSHERLRQEVDGLELMIEDRNHTAWEKSERD